jgi:hypothetical protein
MSSGLNRFQIGRDKQEQRRKEKPRRVGGKPPQRYQCNEQRSGERSPVGTLDRFGGHTGASCEEPGGQCQNEEKQSDKTGTVLHQIIPLHLPGRTELPADQFELIGCCAEAPYRRLFQHLGAINDHDRVFLVNASLGVYPELLQDREAYKARFGRSRWVAFVAACATELRAQRRLRLHIETGSSVRDVQTLTLFVGNNRLQLQQFGAEPEDTLAGTPGDGSMAALILRPVGILSMIGLMLHGAMGRLGEAGGVEGFEFHHMVVKPTLAPGRRKVVVAFDGEVAHMRAPIDIRVLDKPLYLLQATGAANTTDAPETAA